MEESDTNTHKVSDSGYSNSCNSQSLRSSGSSKSRHSHSSGSSGYGGHPSTLGSGTDVFPQPPVTKRNKDKEHKKKKLKSTSVTATSDHHVETKNLAFSPATTNEQTISDNSKPITKASSKTVNKSPDKLLVQGSFNPPNTGTSTFVTEVNPSPQPTLSQSPATDATPVLNEEKDSGLLIVGEPETQETLECFRSSEEPLPQIENEFSAIVSLHDGVVMYTTSTITKVLGFPKDMWLGRSFIDFVHPKDRVAFASHITTGVSLPVEENRCKVSHAAKESFYCCLRQYRGLKANGYGVMERKVTYLPFHLTMTFRDVKSSEKMSLAGEETGIQGSFLIILATLVKSSYTHPEETKNSSRFIMRHQASCQLSYVDADVVQYLGYLPQDMVNHSIFEFYHPEDTPYLKEVYEGVVKAQGQPYRSKPYRFQVQNGGYILMDTEWSAFINPWSKKLEFVIGQHRVLKGPPNPDVFALPNEEENFQISEEVLKESKVIQQEIENLLNETVQRTTEAAKQLASQRCKDLAIFMENLMDEVAKPELKVELPTEEQSFSERDSVMLGEISPHHDYYDSKSYSGTPPSYNQLNYNENIQRFFESKPKTTLSDESGESKMEANRSNSTDEEGKSMPVAGSSLDSSNRKCCSPNNGSGSGGSSGSAGMPGSAASRGDTSATNTSHGSYQPPHLTEALLCRHNEDMEKQMVQKHREQRSKGERDNKKKLPHDKTQEAHGVKRSGSHSWENEPFKASKHAHVDNLLATGNAVPLPNFANMGGAATVPPMFSGSPNVNLWPPFSVTVTPLQSSQPCFAHNTYTGANMSGSPSPHLTSMIPVYYIPTGSQQANLPPRGLTPQEHPGPPHTGMLLPGQPQYLHSQVPVINPMTNMLYHPMQPMYGAPHMLYSSLMLQPSTLLPTPMSQTGMLPATSRALGKQGKPMTESGTPSGVGAASKFQRPASQATSVKAEPGSAMGSIASASIKRALSECSKKDKSLCSPGAPTLSPGPDEDKPREDARGFGPLREVENTTGDDSSYSSFYSFLRTDNTDESMNSYPRDKEFLYPCKSEDMNWERSENCKKSLNKPRPILKDPPWLEQVNVTPDLVYRYQINEKNLETVLENDLRSLKEIQQPLLVNDQLSQLYLEMELEGLSTKLKLEEKFSSSSGSGSGSSGSGAEEGQASMQKKRKRRNIEYGKFVMIFEENAPLPPPLTK